MFNNKVVEPEEEGWQYSVVPGVEGENDVPLGQIFTHILTVPSATNINNGHYECYTGPAASASLNVSVWGAYLIECPFTGLHKNSIICFPLLCHDLLSHSYAS